MVTRVTFVAQDTAPVEITIALPWRPVTRTMLAPWIRDTLITEWTLPTKATPEKEHMTFVEHYALCEHYVDTLFPPNICSF